MRWRVHLRNNAFYNVGIYLLVTDACVADGVQEQDARSSDVITEATSGGQEGSTQSR